MRRLSGVGERRGNQVGYCLCTGEGGRRKQREYAIQITPRHLHVRYRIGDEGSVLEPPVAMLLWRIHNSGYHCKRSDLLKTRIW